MSSLPVYLFPLLMDFVLSGILFISACRFSEAGAAAWVVGATMAAWALIYSSGSFLAGLLVRPAKAVYGVIASGILIALDAAGFIIWDGLYTQFLWIALSGVAMALFFGPFQMYMKLVETGKGPQQAALVRPTALYTGSWSLGFALGALAFGHLPQLTGFQICAAGGLIIAAGVVLIENRRRRRTVPDATPADVPAKAVGNSYSSTFPNLVLIGWLIGGIGNLAIDVVRTLGPFRGINVLNLTKAEMGDTLFLVSLLQSITAFLLIFSKDWMYRKLPAVLMNGAGIAALLLFGLGTNYPTYLAAAVLFGIYSGCFYFFFVFHSLVHPQRSSFYAGVNECIVGAAGVVSPVIGGLLVSKETCGAAFLAAAALTAAGLIVQLTVYARTIRPRKYEI